MTKLLALLFTLLVAAVPSTTMAADPFEIDVILPETGNAAFLGATESASLHQLERYVNETGGIQGRQLKFVFHDDQTLPQVDVQLATQIMAKKPAVILGSTLVALCSATASLMKDGPVQFCFSPGIYPPRGSYVFASTTGVIDLLKATARYYRMKGYTRVAIITSTDASGQDGERNVDTAFGSEEGRGVQIVDREHFNLNDFTVSAQMARIKASGAQAMVAWVSGGSFATVLRGAKDVGLNIPITTSTANLLYKQLDSYKGLIGNNVYFPGPPALAPDSLPAGRVRDAVDTFWKVMKEANVRPDQGFTGPWDSAMIVVDAFRKLGTDATATQIRDYIGNLHDWAGVFGPYDFQKYPQRGLGAGAVVMMRWEPAKGTWVSVSEMGGAPLNQ